MFERRGARFSCRRLVLGLGILALAATLLTPVTVYGEDREIVGGRVVNGTSGGGAPADVEVTLHIFGDNEEIGINTAMTDSDGQFQFQDVEIGDESSFCALATNYQGVMYSNRLDPSDLTEALELVVYEATDSLETIQISADVMLVSEAEQGARLLSVVEFVSLNNAGDRTFVPDLTQPGMMRFLRFSIPSDATNVEVDSDLPGGQIINVGTGFALDAPVTPGSHQVVYKYLLPYGGSRSELTHSFPMGAETFRLLLDTSMGKLEAASGLTPLAPVSVEDESYGAWEARDLSPGARIDVVLGDLPQPAVLDRFGDALADGPYLRIGLPAAVGVAMVALLVYALAFGRLGRAPTVGLEASAPSVGALALAGLGEGSTGRWEDPQEYDQGSLVEAIARLDDLFQRGRVEAAQYERRREDLKGRLTRLAVAPEEG